MFKTKYYYDHKTLSYRKIEKTKGTQLRNILAMEQEHAMDLQQALGK